MVQEFWYDSQHVTTTIVNNSSVDRLKNFPHLRNPNKVIVMMLKKTKKKTRQLSLSASETDVKVYVPPNFDDNCSQKAVSEQTCQKEELAQY